MSTLTPWLNFIRQFDRTNSIVSLIGTKLDLESKRKISHDEAKIFAKTQAIDFHMEVSSLENINISKFLKTTVKELIIRNGNFI